MTGRPAWTGWSDAERARRVFAVGFAAAAVFHVLGNIHLAPDWSVGFLGLAAAWVWLRPASVLAVSALCVTVLGTAWLEAPLLGNHWLLASLVAVAWLLAMHTTDGPDEGWSRFVPAARLVLLVAYGFAAFSKLNADFFDPAVSCAGFYLRESAASWGVESLGGGEGLNRAAAVITAAIELSVPVLLALRRTRPFGVVLGIGFHLLIALDRTHQFFDFSSILTVLFLLFAGPAVHRDLVRLAWAGRDRLARVWSSGPELLRVLGCALVVVTLLAPLGPDTWLISQRYRSAGLGLFWLTGGFVFGVVAVSTWRTRAREVESTRSRIVWWMAIVPLVAVLNGLAPYTEVKTATGWNMYSNLRTADGESNHFLIRSTLPLRDEMDGLVTIIETSDVRLAAVGRDRYQLTFDEFRDFLSDRPDISVTFERNGIVETVERVGDRPDLMVPQSTLEQKFFHFRPVDASGEQRCLTAFGPAR